MIHSDRKSVRKRIIGAFALLLTAATVFSAAPAQAAATFAPTDSTWCGPGVAPTSYTVYYASVKSGYLALRNAKAYDSSNEIGRIQNGEAVYVTTTPKETYWYVYAPTLGMWGFVNSDYLTGGKSASSSLTRYSVKVDSGYLALRTAPAFDSSNEIGQLYTGDTVDATSDWSGDYVWVYSSKHGKWGYVNGNYLTGGKKASDPGTTRYSVKVQSGYLALRTAPAFERSNEIGELYTGDVVDVTSYRSGDYVWVYSPKHNQWGYVNAGYLVGSSSGSSAKTTDYTVKVDSGYLALRTAPAFERANEIGELYTGDTFQATSDRAGDYVWGYSPKHKKWGYVNSNYLTSKGSSSSSARYTVKVDSGYLALRNAPAFDSSNEIGKLYTGDSVEVEKAEGQYWWVYSPKLNKSGYVNKDYLVK